MWIKNLSVEKDHKGKVKKVSWEYTHDKTQSKKLQDIQITFEIEPMNEVEEEWFRRSILPTKDLE